MFADLYTLPAAAWALERPLSELARAVEEELIPPAVTWSPPAGPPVHLYELQPLADLAAVSVTHVGRKHDWKLTFTRMELVKMLHMDIFSVSRIIEAGKVAPYARYKGLSPIYTYRKFAAAAKKYAPPKWRAPGTSTISQFCITYGLDKLTFRKEVKAAGLQPVKSPGDANSRPFYRDVDLIDLAWTAPPPVLPSASASAGDALITARTPARVAGMTEEAFRAAAEAAGIHARTNALHDYAVPVYPADRVMALAEKLAPPADPVPDDYGPWPCTVTPCAYADISPRPEPPENYPMQVAEAVAAAARAGMSSREFWLHLTAGRLPHTITRNRATGEWTYLCNESTVKTAEKLARHATK